MQITLKERFEKIGIPEEASSKTWSITSSGIPLSLKSLFLKFICILKKCPSRRGGYIGHKVKVVGVYHTDNSLLFMVVCLFVGF